MDKCGRNAATVIPYNQGGAVIVINALFDFPESPSETFIGLRHTPHTPRLDLRGMPPAGLRLGTGP